MNLTFPSVRHPWVRLRSTRQRAGFTLAEIVIALGLIALVILSVLGVIAAAGRQIERVIAIDQAVRITPALQYSLDTRRVDLNSSGQQAAGETEVERFSRWLECVQNETPLVAFSYRAQVPGGGGTMNSEFAIPTPKIDQGDAWVQARLGEDYIIYDAVLPLVDFKSFLSSENDRGGSIVGQALVVVLSESQANPVPLGGVSAGDYTEAVVAAEAKFYIPDRYSNQSFDTLVSGITSGNRKPVHTINVAFNR